MFEEKNEVYECLSRLNIRLTNDKAPHFCCHITVIIKFEISFEIMEKRKSKKDVCKW